MSLALFHGRSFASATVQKAEHKTATIKAVHFIAPRFLAPTKGVGIAPSFTSRDIAQIDSESVCLKFGLHFLPHTGAAHRAFVAEEQKEKVSLLMN
jgi:hypothetical protein